MRLLLALASGLLVPCAAACARGGNGDAVPAPQSPQSALATPLATAAADCAVPRAVPARTSTTTTMSGGLDRRYIVHIPPSYNGRNAMPLVLALHPFAGNAELMLNLTRFPELADRAGFIVVAPDGTGDPQFWNIAKYHDAADDVAFLRALIARLDADLCIDPDRTYVTGYSSGGGMALRLACEMPDRIAAVAVVASQYVSCDADVPLIAFHGTSDLLLPFEGGADPDAAGVALVPVRRAVSEWARQLGCDGLAQITMPSSEIEVSTYQRCRQGAGETLLYTILRGGHAWPGAVALPDYIVGRTTQQIDATKTIWDFFAAHPRVR